MPEIYADWSRMRSVADDMGLQIGKLEEIVRGTDTIKRNLFILGKEESQIRAAIDKCNRKTAKSIVELRNCKNVLVSASDKYMMTEHPILGILRADRIIRLMNFSNRGTADPGSSDQSQTPGGFLDLNGTYASSTWNESVTISGVPLSVGVIGNFLTGQIKSTGGAKFDLKKKEVGVSAGITAEGSVLQGKIDEQVGDLYLNGQADLLTGAVSGKIGATLFKDGKFNPSLFANGEAKVAVAKGKVGARYGDEKNNVHVNADGSVLGAEAHVKSQIGMLEYTDSSGNKQTGFGVAASAGAEAYVAKGRVSGGFSLFGVKVDIGAEGKLLDAGASAGVEYIPGKFKGKIGAGLGLGAGLDISIDWSNVDTSMLERFKFW